MDFGNIKKFTTNSELFDMVHNLCKCLEYMINPFLLLDGYCLLICKKNPSVHPFYPGVVQVEIIFVCEY